MSLARLIQIQSDIRVCRDCPAMVGRPVHGSAILSPIYLLGQAPGPREESFGRPFAYTAGRTLFRWFEETSGVSEDDFRARVYMAAVARCFPGKGKSGDRVPNREEIENCRRHILRETQVLKPKLLLPVGKLALSEVLGARHFPASAKLVDVIGKSFQIDFHGQHVDVIPLPHPSGLSAWHKTEPGKTLLKRALGKIVDHPVWREFME